MKLTNETKIGLSMAVFLATDDYDYDPRPNAISATGLLKSIRQTVLIQRAKSQPKEADISSLIASRFGWSIHDGIERAWSDPNNVVRALVRLGYPEKQAKRVVVNHGYVKNPLGQLVKDPNAKPLPKDAIPVYMEIRSERPVDEFIVTGKFDFLGDGELEDHKTTGVFSYMKEPLNPKFRQQGSIYRWLNPDLVTSDRMLINYTFTDWNKLRAMIESKKGYPPQRMISVPHTLMTLEETDDFIKNKIRAIKTNMALKEEQLPPCTPEELWQDPTVFKYYKNPNNKTRATKNFDNFAEAQSRLLQDGSVGVIDIVPGQAKHCLYCAGATLCSQAKQMVMDGCLDMEL